MRPRIMYIERKSESLDGDARIGWVSFSKRGRTLYYDGKTFQKLKGAGFKANYENVATGEHYWITGCKKDGGDRLYGGSKPVDIDEDVRVEYWKQIRGELGRASERNANR